MSARTITITALATLALAAPAEARDLVRINPGAIRGYTCDDFEYLSFVEIREHGRMLRMHPLENGTELAVDYRRAGVHAHISTTVDQHKRIVWNKGREPIFYDPHSDCPTR